MVIRDHLRVLDWCCPFEGGERSVELGIQLVNWGFNKLSQFPWRLYGTRSLTVDLFYRSGQY